MAYYYTCPDCGANLDPGEKCDCQNNDNKNFKEVSVNDRNQNHDCSS